MPDASEDGDATGESGVRCQQCGNPNQHPRLILDPATGRKYDFFECIVCRHQSWQLIEER